MGKNKKNKIKKNKTIVPKIKGLGIIKDYKDLGKIGAEDIESLFNNETLEALMNLDGGTLSVKQALQQVL